MIRAALSNPSHPEYGVATIPFPIPHDQYARCMELLEALEIGDASKPTAKLRRSTVSTPSSSARRCSRSMWRS